MKNKELYLLVRWIEGHPILDGAKFAETKQELLNYYNTLPKLQGVEYTICQIYGDIKLDNITNTNQNEL